ncbi:two component, sigma54 specific, transcriptional regulator, Fis family [Desulfofundulus kuznetsovii DSM 6115]|jgi:two-component system response regulator AtoC|uniref:Stage 0 sporulation protein A homolog n=1 Tax=Desulfofundulus kuznetsovii (strain DSM 6115 / VKM B-1805 / 17) TaxID=760568 RepID=A0AAU8PVH8_DESK7|nr:two component, sigma54 specific, transcriptional regulator, Fis family [Desulfofundulus kuznetsovii DSM 6115]
MEDLILVVDDEESVRQSLKDILTDYGYRVETARDGREGLEKITTLDPATVIMDIRMPEVDGIKVLELVRLKGQDTPIILITAYGSTQSTIEAMKMGAFDYLLKPLQVNELIETVKKATEVKRLMRKTPSLTARDVIERADVMIGLSPEMQKVYKAIGRVANSNATVLIRGESGTGKELVARAIHYNSDRRDKPFIKINCASIPENLLESEMFGYEKGAFTGAITSKPGKFELAQRGTIFFDEIGEMSLSLQAKLLRVIQEREFERLGGTETIKVDVRIIAATNKDLENCIAEGTFREDLFYRLNVVDIYLPPLRERKDDIPVLVEHMIKLCNAEYKKQVTGFTDQAMKLLLEYDWPGNVRELKNVCERAVLMSTGPLLTVEDLPRNIRKSSRRLHWLKGLSGDSFKEMIAEVEREIILQALEEHNWNRSAAAQALKMNRSSLYLKMKELGIID